MHKIYQYLDSNMLGVFDLCCSLKSQWNIN